MKKRKTKKRLKKLKRMEHRFSAGFKRKGTQKKFMSYKQARLFIIKQGITTKRQFEQWSQKRPHNFPSQPNKTYKAKWKGFGEFLGTGRKAGNKRDFMSYKQARQFIIKQRITTKSRFEEWSKSGKRPHNFPSQPSKIYKAKWKGFGEFLGTGRKAGNKRDFMSYKQARQFIIKQRITTKSQFEKWSKSRKRPYNFPSAPWKIYKTQWKGLGEFLGTGKKRNRKDFMSYRKARQFIVKQKIETKDQFEKWSKSRKRPYNFPSAPWRVYKTQWKGFKVFLKPTVKKKKKRKTV